MSNNRYQDHQEAPSDILHARGDVMMQLDESEEADIIPLSVKVDLLKSSIDKVQKYELLTTNQYIQQMELVVEIIRDISERQMLEM